MTDPAGPAASHTAKPMSHHVQRQTFAERAWHVWGLTGLVIAQSVYDRLAHQTEYLIDPNVTPAAIGGVVLLLSVLLPALMTGMLRLTGFVSPKAQDAAYLAFVFLMAALMSLQLTQRITFLPGVALLMMAAIIAVAMTSLYTRYPGIRRTVSWLSCGALIYPVLLWHHLSRGSAATPHSAEQTSDFKPIPIVFLVFDEFSGSSLMTPEYEIDEERFPHFAQLRRQSTWYRRAACVSPTTNRSLPAMLTGSYFQSSHMLGRVDLPQNLFSLLATAGEYDIAAFEPISVLAPHRKVEHTRSLLDRSRQSLSILSVLSNVYMYDLTPDDLHEYIPPIPHCWFGINDGSQVVQTECRGAFRYGWSDPRDDQFEHLLRCIDETPDSILYFSHILIPHSPWCFFPSGRRYARDRDDQDRLCLEHDGEDIQDELGAVQNQQRYLLQLMYVDRQLGRIEAKLKKVGIWDRCLLIVTGDHGVSFRSRLNRREFTQGNTADILSVPLFVKWPGQRVPEVDDRPVQSIDLLPTTLATVGIRPMAPIDGRPLSDPAIEERTHYTILDFSNDAQFPRHVLEEPDGPSLLRHRFGRGDDPWNIYRVGPHSEWLGKQLTEFTIDTERQETVECLSPAGRYETEAEGSPQYYLQGRVVGVAVPDIPYEFVAVVNGLVMGTTRTYQQFGYADRWSMLLPEWSGVTVDSPPQVYRVGENASLIPCHIHWVKAFGE